MAVYRLIIKTSPDLSFPLEPHPVLDPAVYLQAPVPNPPLTPRLRPEDVPPPDVFFRSAPHPSLNAAIWEQNRLSVPPTIPKQRRELSPMSEHPFTVEPHPSLNTSSWEQAPMPPQPLVKAAKPPRPATDEPAIIPVVVASSISTWSHLQPAVAPIPKRWVRPFIDEPLTYAAANPSIIWARWSSDQPATPQVGPRRALISLADQPFISTTAAVLTPDKYQANEPLRFRTAPLIQPRIDYAVWTVKHSSLNPAAWETSRFPTPPQTERRSYAERRKHDEPQFIPRNPTAAYWSHITMDRQWITSPKKRQEMMAKLPLIDDVFWVLLVRNLLPDSIVATLQGHLSDRTLSEFLNDRSLLAKFLDRTMENL